MKAILKD
jgi:hypothetical protein